MAACSITAESFDGIEPHGTFELRRDFADDLDALRFELLEMGVFAQSYARNGDPEIDVFAREGIFIERVLVGLLGQSEVVLEHITTERRQPSCRPVPSGSP